MKSFPEPILGRGIRSAALAPSNTERLANILQTNLELIERLNEKIQRIESRVWDLEKLTDRLRTELKEIDRNG